VSRPFEVQPSSRYFEGRDHAAPALICSTRRQRGWKRPTGRQLWLRKTGNWLCASLGEQTAGKRYPGEVSFQATFSQSSRSIGSWTLLNTDPRCTQEFQQPTIPIQRRATGAAKDIQARRAEFGECVNCQMGLLQKPDPGNSRCPGELMPDRPPHGTQVHF
jgi:hypothetical protein